MNVFFVTGTGTDVGKTVVTALLASLFEREGRRVGVMKPVQTGAVEGHADLERIAAWVPGVTTLPMELASPYVFSLAASPHLAARTAGRRIEPQVILDAVARLGRENSVDVLLVEGAGGVCVPLNEEGYLMLDLMMDLACQVYVVADAGLGTLNHSLLSLSALRSRGVAVRGVVINRMPAAPGAIERDNMETIEHLSGVKVLFSAPMFPEVSAEMISRFCQSMDPATRRNTLYF